jgi:hypothetical protein
MMDFERFKQLYNEGVTYAKMAKQLHSSISTIVHYKKQLNLPDREYKQETLKIDEALFRKLYADGADYDEIAKAVGCAKTSVVNIRRRLGLPDRETKQKRNIDLVKLKQRYNSGATHAELCEEFEICEETLQRKIKKCGLPRRKNESLYEEQAFREAYMSGMSVSYLAKKFKMHTSYVFSRAQSLGLPSRKTLYNESEFIKAHIDGLTIVELAEKFKISKNTVLWHVQDLRLSSRAKQKNIVVEPLISQPEPARSDEKVKCEECIKTKVTAPMEPVIEPEVQPIYKNMTATFIVPPKSLREIEKLQLEQNIRKAERQFKITHKDQGFGSLINHEIEDQIMSPFTRSL